MLEEKPQLFVEVGAADIGILVHSLSAKADICGGIDVLLRIAARRDICEGGDHRLAKVALTARKETVEVGIVQVWEAQGEEHIHGLLVVGHDVDKVDEAMGLLALVLVKLPRSLK